MSETRETCDDCGEFTYDCKCEAARLRAFVKVAKEYRAAEVAFDKKKVAGTADAKHMAAAKFDIALAALESKRGKT
jgi:hypothetical protein